MAAVEAPVAPADFADSIGSKVDAALADRGVVESPAGVARTDFVAMLGIEQIVAEIILAAASRTPLVIGALVESYDSATWQTLDFATELLLLEFAFASWHPQAHYDAVAFLP